MAALGAKVSLISGPVGLDNPRRVGVTRVETAVQMLEAARAALPAEAAVFTAAVADWRVANPAPHKMKKRGGPPALEFTQNPDILASLAAPGASRPRLVVGFAAETQDVAANAAAKRAAKNADWIVANDVRPDTGIMGGDHNQVSIFDAAGREDWPSLGKDEVARRLASRIAQALGVKPG